MVEAPDGPPSRRDRLDWAIGDLIGWGWAWMVRRGAIGPQSRRARRVGAFGENSAVTFPTLALYNEHYIHLGSGTIVGPQCSLSVGMLPGQRMVSEPVITIGDRCVIGRGSSIVGHLSITIGDDVFTGPNIYVTDQNHVYRDPDVPIGRQVPTEAAVEIGRAPVEELAEVVCLEVPRGFGAVGFYYDDFDQVDDDTVIDLLRAPPTC